MLKKTGFKRISKALLLTVLAVIIVLNVTSSLLANFGIRESLQHLPYTALNVQGGSMTPTMNKGDLLIIGAEPYAELEIGDDITFFIDGELVTHRIEDKIGAEYVTKGLANGIEDMERISEDDYCGKVIICIPYIGNVWQLLAESHVAALASVLIIILLCFGAPLAKKIKAVFGGSDEHGGVRCGATRIFVFLTMLSLVFSSPYFTSAKYIDRINRLEVAVAQPLYFTSNYLAEGNGNRYYIQGWNGSTYNFNLQIRNYANELLYNSESVPVRYGLGTRICTDEGYSVDYELSITAPADAKLAQNFKYPSSWETDGITQYAAYEIEGGAKKRNDFSVNVVPKYGTAEDESLPVDSKIRFEIFATTEQGETYSIKLLGIFEMHVAQDLDFIGAKEVVNLDTMVTLNVKTNLISDGTDERVLLFSWDPRYLYINEYESTAFNVITNNPTYFDKTNGRFWMKVPAFANINLEFFKRDINLDTNGDNIPDLDPSTFDYSISVDVVDSVGALPEATE